jgi:hypothetical protein
MEFFFLWFGLAIGVGAYASSKGRSGFGWFLLSCLISPLLGFIFCAIASDEKKQAAEAAALAASKPCPQCAELVKREAKVCRFCGHAFAAADAA